MRWKAKPPRKDGDRKMRMHFLWLPRCDAKEWRWLEYAITLWEWDAYDRTWDFVSFESE